MASREKPLEKEMAIFVKAHMGKGIFAPFTGTDYAAWKAWCHLIALYGRSGDVVAIDALRSTLRCAQRKECIWEVFVQSIPGVLDWSDVKDLWPKIVEPIVPGEWPRERLARSEIGEGNDHLPKWMCAVERGTGGEIYRKHGLGMP